MSPVEMDTHEAPSRGFGGSRGEVPRHGPGQPEPNAARRRASPAATLSSAILREMKKGKDSRFKKTGRGQFALNALCHVSTPSPRPGRLGFSPLQVI
jgi:hypothetical protein